MPATGPRHVLLHGPPAAGKLTVARALASAYDLKVLDNHLTVDVALRLFEFGTKPFGRLVDRLRLDLLEAAAEAGMHSVSTLVFAYPVDRPFIDRVVAVLERYGGTVSCIQLRPPLPVLEQRITDPSRAEARKLRDVAVLRRLFEQWDLSTPITADDLSVDNSELSAEDTAALIARHVGL